MSKKGKKKKAEGGDVATNRRARHKFQLLEKMEAGVALQGSEVKSLRDGKASINEAYAVIDKGELWLRGAHIPPYLPASSENHEPERPRKLLLHRREIERLMNQPLARGLYLVATPIGNLGDITLRALAVLARADYVYCEDTRSSRTLLSRYGIGAALRTYHEHNAETQRPQVLAELAAGRPVLVRHNDYDRRLYNGDVSLWTGSDEAAWLGWIPIVEQQLDDLSHLERIQDDVKRKGFEHVLLLGMGGSSLAPEVFKETFGKLAGYPELHVLDSTDPAQVKAFEQKVDVTKTLFIVSSKSGSTLEPNIFKAYFFDKVKQAMGAAEAGRRFVAVTDPGSALQKEAEADGFRAIFPGLKSIGGRYSALSNFGMVPAAAMGLNVHQLLDEAERMVYACAPGVPAEENPGLVLGTIMGSAANLGIDKLTLVASPALHDLGAWLEQLLAESTGKEGKAIIPVDREEIGAPEVYGDDRLFAYLRLDSAPNAAQDKAVAALEKAGKPVVRIGVMSTIDIGEEFFRWEVATAIAGAIMKINPFNQPDVEASKVATRALTSEYEKTGKLPEEAPFWSGDGVKLFSDAKNVDALNAAIQEKSLVGYLRAHLGRLGKGDYFGLLAYVQMNRAHEDTLQALRHRVRDARKTATCLGFGPRFLHSTGQAYKGGPNSGVFLQITAESETAATETATSGPATPGPATPGPATTRTSTTRTSTGPTPRACAWPPPRRGGANSSAPRRRPRARQWPTPRTPPRPRAAAPSPGSTSRARQPTPPEERPRATREAAAPRC